MTKGGGVAVRQTYRSATANTSTGHSYHVNFVNAVFTLTGGNPNIPDKIYETMQSLFEAQNRVVWEDVDRALVLLSEKYATLTDDPSMTKKPELRFLEFKKRHAEYRIIANDIVRRILTYFSVRANTLQWSGRT